MKIPSSKISKCLGLSVVAIGLTATLIDLRGETIVVVNHGSGYDPVLVYPRRSESASVIVHAHPVVYTSPVIYTAPVVYHAPAVYLTAPSLACTASASSILYFGASRRSDLRHRSHDSHHHHSPVIYFPNRGTTHRSHAFRHR